MPSDILRAGNGTTDAIVTILGRLGPWEVLHLEKSAKYGYNGSTY